MPEQEEIQDQIYAAIAKIKEIDKGSPGNRGYYLGIREALGWVLRETDEPPLQIED